MAAFRQLESAESSATPRAAASTGPGEARLGTKRGTSLQQAPAPAMELRRDGSRGGRTAVFSESAEPSPIANGRRRFHCRRNAMQDEFRIGDLVRVKTHSDPIMTVAEDRQADAAVSDDLVYCEWDDHGTDPPTRRAFRFSKADLVHVAR
jgi:uncharacterized protein YodC (DUF2158 family)